MKYLHKICLAAVLAALVAVLCGCNADDYTLPAQVDMQPGESVALAALVRYTGPENEQATAEDAAALLETLGSVDNIKFDFASSVPGVVSVDEEGVMTAGVTGDATVIASCAALDYYAEVRVSVRTMPQRLTVEPVAALAPGESYILNAEVRPGKKYAQLLYITADESVATVDENGVITAVAAGETDVTAQVAGSSLAAVCRVVVTQEDEMMQGVTISRGEAAMTAGETLLLSAETFPDGNATVTWQSTDEKVATVDENGVVMAVGAGAATVTAALGDSTAACTVTVTGPATAESATPETANAQSEEAAEVVTAETWDETARNATGESAASPETAAPETATAETAAPAPATAESATPETAAAPASATPESARAESESASEAATPESATEENAALPENATPETAAAEPTTPETAAADEMETIDLDVFYAQTPESATAGSATHDEEDAKPEGNPNWPHLPNGMPQGPGPVIPQTPETAIPAETPETAQPAEPAQDETEPAPQIAQTPETATPETATPETATPETEWDSAAEEAAEAVREWVGELVTELFG